MLRRGLFPIIKKKILLFLALVFVTTIGVMFSTGFLSCYLDYKRESLAYVNNYGLPDILLNTNKTFTDEDVSSIKVDGAEVFYRYQGDAQITINDKVYTTKLTTFDDNSFSKRYVVNEVADSLDKINLNLDFAFASNAKISVGSVGEIKLNGVTKDLLVNKIVGNPESISYDTASFVPVDRFNYGCSYLNKKNVETFSIKNNQVIVKINDTSKSKDTIYKDLANKLSKKSIGVSSLTYKENNSNYKAIISTAEDMKKAAVIVPIVCISIVLILVFLFMYQVSKSLTHEFGIMIALGNSLTSILFLLLGFATIVTLTSSILGIICGHTLSSLVYSIFKVSFFVPCGYGGVLLNVCLYSSLAALGVTYLAVFSTILVIKRISPLEAINNSKNRYKPLIKPIEKLVDLSGNSTKIAVTSVCKERVRSVVSIFAIIASFMICLGSINLYKSQQGLINQLYDRCNYEAEVYIKSNDQTKVNEVISFVDNEKAKGIVKEYERTITSSLKINGTGSNYTFTGIEDSNMHNIYNSSNNRISFNQEDTVVIDELFARENNYKKGQTVTINDIPLLVQDIAHNCSYKRNYMSYKTLVKVVNNKSSWHYFTLSINTNNLNEFIKDLSNTNYSAQVINIDTYMKTITGGHQAIVSLTKGLVVLGLLLGLATLTVMAITSMNEQKRKFSIMQSLGIKLSEVSKVIFIENVIYLIIGIAIAIPSSMYFAKWMIDVCTTRHNALFNFNYWWFYVLVAGLIILLSVIAHIISIIKIKHTNLVENTCSRE